MGWNGMGWDGRISRQIDRWLDFSNLFAACVSGALAFHTQATFVALSCVQSRARVLIRLSFELMSSRGVSYLRPTLFKSRNGE